MNPRWHAYPDPRSAAQFCARHIIARLDEALTGRDRATLALSGGTSPKPMFEALAASGFPWQMVHFFWVDERAVPPTDPESNYRMAAEAFLLPARVPPGNIHRIPAELVPEAAARHYSQDIREFFGLAPGEMPQFDVIHLGMGPDCHTASLFPGEPLIEDRQGIAAAVYVEKKSQWRITLLPGPLLAASNTVVLAAGEDKAEPLRAVFHEPADPLRCPAQLTAARAVWFLDEAAARLLV